MNGNRQESVGLRDGLAAYDLLAGPNKGHCRLTNVLREGEDHARRKRHPTNRTAGSALVRVGMNPARECVAMEDGQEAHGGESLVASRE